MQHRRTTFFTTLCLFAATLWVASAAHAQMQEVTTGSTAPATATDQNNTPVILTRLISSHHTVTPGQTISIAWEFKLQPHWHIYYSNAGDSGLPPELKPEGGQRLALTFPTPEVISIPPVTNYGYKDSVTFTTSYTVPQLPEGLQTLTFKAGYLYCNDICMPGTSSFSLPLTVASAAQANPGYNPQQNLPQPLPAPLAARLNATAVAITLPESLLTPTAHFVPNADGIIADSAPQTLQGNQLIVPLDDQSQTPPTRINGLLLINGKSYVVDSPLTASGMQTSAATPPQSTQPEVSTGSFMGAVFFALLAGLVLNLMPCVLPVLSLKLLALIKHHHGPERINQTLAYTGGILATFWAFALAVFLIQRGGTQLGWGFHLQNPLFVATLALLMLAVALNFFGIYEVGHGLTRLGAKPDKAPRHPLWQSFGTGVLAVIVATPCTVPFMGGAMAYAFTQPLPQSLAVFTSLGIGLALPFIVAIPFPHIFRWLPKPGAWMQTFRHALGWPMLATALWLTFVFAAQTMAMGGLIPVYALFTFAILFSFSLWFYGTRRTPQGRRLPVLAVLLTVVACIGALHTLLLPPSGAMPQQWGKWSPEAVQKTAQTQPVFVDFTADWCVTCKVTEATVLNTTRVQTLFKTHNVALFRADWTLQDPAITAELAAHGRKGVPLYLYYPAGGQPQILPQLLTPGVLEDAIGK